MFRWLSVLLVFLPMMAESSPVQPPELGIQAPGAQSGTIHVDPDRPTAGKRFRGVWFTPENGIKTLVAYNAHSIWAQFDGQTVSVSGEEYVPQGQAIQAPHFRIHRLTVTDPNATGHYISAGPETERSGTLTLARGEPGSKMANETWWVFRTGGMQYQLLNPGRWTLTQGEVTLRAHDVQRSPFSAHMSGPSLWVTTLKRR